GVAEFDDIAVALLPIVEKGEVFDYALDRRTHADGYSSAAPGRHGKKGTRPGYGKCAGIRSVAVPDAAGGDRLLRFGGSRGGRIVDHAHGHARGKLCSFGHGMERRGTGLAHIGLTFAHAGNVA